MYFKYLFNNKNDISLLSIYYSKEIYSKYIIQVSEKSFTVVDHLSKIYGLSDIYKCINRNLPLCLVLDINMRQKLFFSFTFEKRLNLSIFKKNKMQDYNKTNFKTLTYTQI